MQGENESAAELLAGAAPNSRPVDVVIASRIYSPEPSAASFRLGALARACVRAGARVQVLTSRPPAGIAPQTDEVGITVRRARVLRDKAGYVRGYVQYMSFDIPLFFRLLWVRRPSLVVVEPPPTTGVIVRVVCRIRRIPYAYYAADVWSDAVGAVGTPGVVARVVRWCELFAMRGASRVLSVSTGVSERLAELGITQTVETIGNGVEASAFAQDGEAVNLGAPYFLYAGTASEVHGASIFFDAFSLVHAERPEVKLVFLGQGTDLELIRERAAQLPSGTVRFLPREEPAGVARWLRGAVASLASVRPGQGYDFAFPTKMYASACAGTNIIFSGVGPGAEFISQSEAGWATPYDADAVADAMRQALQAAKSEDAGARRDRLASWSREHVDLDRVADRAVRTLVGAIEGTTLNEGRDR